MEEVIKNSEETIIGFRAPSLGEAKLLTYKTVRKTLKSTSIGKDAIRAVSDDIVANIETLKDYSRGIIGLTREVYDVQQEKYVYLSHKIYVYVSQEKGRSYVVHINIPEETKRMMQRNSKQDTRRRAPFPQQPWHESDGAVNDKHEQEEA